MSKTITFRGNLQMGLQDQLSLATIKGKVGYRIKKFQVMQERPGQISATYVAKIYSKNQTSFTSTVNFTEGDLMAVCYVVDHASNANPYSESIIFDNQMTNQDMFVSITEADGGTEPANYHIELEAVSITDTQATQLTLKNMRDVLSR
jgi:hypothetical protein|tara:strand:+ start:413 stop:856 length:444 start_codon:yes stop_codon:yes gene_type:complete